MAAKSHSHVGRTRVAAFPADAFKGCPAPAHPAAANHRRGETSLTRRREERVEFRALRGARLASTKVPWLPAREREKRRRVVFFVYPAVGRPDMVLDAPVWRVDLSLLH
ncbi:hypothetical protein MRX96_045404 [Rhipicephalus microplus]